MKKRFTFQDAIFCITVILSIGTIFVFFTTFKTQELAAFFSSDTLYLPSIYKDIFIDHNSLKGWHLNPAPNIFPDMIVYFIIMVITSNFILSSFIFAIIQYSFFIYLIFRLFKAINLPNPKLIAALSNLLLLLFFMVWFYSNDFIFTFFLVSNSYHTGAFIMSLLCSVLTIEYLNAKQTKTLLYLSIISMLCVFSDRLFIFLYIIPWLFMLACYFRVDQRKKLLQISLVNICSLMMGIVAFNLLKNSNFVYVDEPPQNAFKFSDIGDSFNMLIKQMHIYLTDMNYKTTILVISLITLVCMIIMSLKRFRTKKNFCIKDIYLIFSVVFSIVVFFAPVITGKYTGFDTIRYNIYIFYLLIINSGIGIYYIIQKIEANAIKIAHNLIIILIIGASLNIAHQYKVNGFKNYLNYYPQRVATIDEISKREKLYCGLGDYWKAKEITMFSKNGVRVYTSLEALYIWEHVMNNNWYKNGRFNFIISENKKQDSAINNYFNYKTRIIKSDNLNLVITPEFRINSFTNKTEPIFTPFPCSTDTDKVRIEKIKCGAEQKSANGKYFIADSSNVELEGACAQSSENVFSGKYSAKLTHDCSSSMTYRFKDVEPGEYFTISVCRFSTKENGVLIASANNGKEFHLTQSKAIKKFSNGWEKLSLEFYINFKPSDGEIAVYLWNQVDTPVYFDDLMITRFIKN